MRGKSSFHFDNCWIVDAHPDAVFDVLAAVEDYPSWWPEVTEVEERGPAYEVVCRSVLPYSLRLRMTHGLIDKEAGLLQASLQGDLDGWARWRVQPVPAGSSIEYEQVVLLTKPRFSAVGWLAGPLLRINHELMMRSGERGLNTRLQR